MIKSFYDLFTICQDVKYVQLYNYSCSFGDIIMNMKQCVSNVSSSNSNSNTNTHSNSHTYSNSNMVVGIVI